jgi:hypothetical protein
VTTWQDASFLLQQNKNPADARAAGSPLQQTARGRRIQRRGRQRHLPAAASWRCAAREGRKGNAGREGDMLSARWMDGLER